MRELGGGMVFGQDIVFSSFSGVIEDVQSWTTNSVWSEGGGGYVHPQYGGYVEAPMVYSLSDHHLRVRVAWDNGEIEYVDIPGYVKIGMGDAVKFISCVNNSNKMYHWVALVNVATGNWYIFGDIFGITKFYPSCFAEKVGTFFLRLFKNNDRLVGSMASVVVIFFCAFVLAFPVRYTGEFFKLLKGLEEGFFCSLWFIFFGVMWAVRKVEKKIKNAESQLKRMRMNALQAAVGTGR